MRPFQCAALDKWSSLLFDAPCFDLSGYHFFFLVFNLFTYRSTLEQFLFIASYSDLSKHCKAVCTAPYTDLPGYPLVMCIVVPCAIFSPASDVHYSFSVPCSDSHKYQSDVHHWSMRHTLTYEGTPNEVHRVVICCTPTCKDTTGCCEFGMG